jgi:hypothetical protein
MYCPFISSKYSAKSCFSKTLHEKAGKTTQDITLIMIGGQFKPHLGSPVGAETTRQLWQGRIFLRLSFVTKYWIKLHPSHIGLSHVGKVGCKNH